MGFGNHAMFPTCRHVWLSCEGLKNWCEINHGSATVDGGNPAITTWDVHNPVNNGINYLSTGASSSLPIQHTTWVMVTSEAAVACDRLTIADICGDQSGNHTKGPEASRKPHWIYWFITLNLIPSRKLTYPTWGKEKSSTQICQTSGGYVNSLEGINFSVTLLLDRNYRGQFWSQMFASRVSKCEWSCESCWFSSGKKWNISVCV